MSTENGSSGSIVREKTRTSAGVIEVHVPAVIDGASDRVDEIVVVAEMDDRQGAGGTFSAVVYDEDGNRTTDEDDEPRSPEVSFGEDPTPEGFPEFEGVVLTTIGGRFAAANIGDEIAIEFNRDEILRAPREAYQYVGGTGAEVLSRLFLPDRVGGGADEGRVEKLEETVERQSEAIAELRAELSETQAEANVDVPDGGSSFGELGEAAEAFLDEIIDG